jgi:2-dehydropantoate 2-reductase
VVRYSVLPKWLQPTTIGEPDGRLTSRLQALAPLFKAAGFPTAISWDMLSWLTCHVAIVSPLANALFLANGRATPFADSRRTVRLAVEAIREGHMLCGNSE